LTGRMKLVGKPEVRLAPFQLSSSLDLNAGGDQIAVLINCGIHAARVVGKGGSKIQEISDRSGALLRVTKTSGLCEIRGNPLAVAMAKQIITDITVEGDARDLRAAISQALTSSGNLIAENSILFPSASRSSFLSWETGELSLRRSVHDIPYRPLPGVFESPLNLQ